MKSKIRKKLTAFMLCMVLVICNSVSILADAPALETATTQQIKETKGVKEEKASEESETKEEEDTSKQSEDEKKSEENKTDKKEETSSEATTKKKEETTEASTEKKEEASTEGKKEEAASTEEKNTESTEKTTDKEDTKEASTEKKETEKGSTEKTEDTKPVTKLEYENDEVKITVSQVSEGAIPEGAKLKVLSIKNSASTSSQYAEVEKKLQEKAEETETEIKGFLAYDITFIDEKGNEIEPNSEVKVTMEYKEAAIPAGIDTEEAKAAEVSVLHLEEDSDGNVTQVVDMGKAGKIAALDTTDENEVKKVEVKTESFSYYTIYWYEKNNSWFSKDSVEVHYVDVNGHDLETYFNLDNKFSNDSNEHGIDSPINLEDDNSKYKVDIEGYTYQYATVATEFENAPEATQIKQLRLHEKDDKYSIQYKVGNKWQSFGDNQSVYMVYKPIIIEGGSGGGSSATGNLAHEKYVTAKENGTYDLTLNVTGAQGTENNPAKVDIVFVLDLSNSMEGANLTSAKAAASTLINTLKKNNTVDSRWKLVKFGSAATTVNKEWVNASSILSSINGCEAYSKYGGDGGTNYEAALTKAGSAISTAGTGHTKIVVFLTDGQPTYHGDNDRGGGTYTLAADYNGAINGAKNVTCDQFYAIGLGLNAYQNIYDNLTAEGILRNVASNVNSPSKTVNNVGRDGLTNAFAAIGGEIINYNASNVFITDTLTAHVDQAAGTNVTVKVTDKNGADVTRQEQNKGAGLVGDYNHETKELTLDFADNYILEQDYTYSVTMTIKPNEEATKLYTENGFQYPHTGEEGTGVTSAGKLGIFSNVEDSAKVTWTTNGTSKEGLYNRPVVQLKEAFTTEPVNFYLNLSSQILDTSGKITGQDTGSFTTSVSGNQSAGISSQGIGVPIHPDLRVKLPEDHVHRNYVVGVIGGTDSTNAKEVDGLIRALENGTNGNQTGQTDKTYQIINGQGEAYFPTDEEIFKYIRDYWNSPNGGVNKGKAITVNGAAIDKNKLTTQNFGIRWYVFKDQSADYWHIDGILVPKSGVLNVTKTFPNEEIAEKLKDSFEIQVTGNFLGESEETVIRKKITDTTGVTKTINDDKTVTYTWHLAIFGTEYSIEEFGYQTSADFDWKYKDTNWQYTPISGNGTSGQGISQTVKTECQWSDEGDAVQKSQTFAFTNNYDLQTTDLDLVKTSENFNSKIDGAKFSLHKKTETGWESVQDVEVNTSNTEFELTGLTTNIIYKLEEIEAPEAHTLLGKPIYFTVKNGKVILCDEAGDVTKGTDDMWKLSEDGKVLTIKNNILYSLPSTGGPGIYWYMISGMLIMMGTALMVYKNQRKREVLLKK